MSRFRHTGIRSTQLNISRDSAYLTSNDGLLISAPMSHQNIVIMDVLVMSGSGKLCTGAGGTGVHLCNINQGYNHVRAPISVPNGQAVYTDVLGGDVTVTYAIGPNFSDTGGATGGSSTGTTGDPYSAGDCNANVGSLPHSPLPNGPITDTWQVTGTQSQALWNVATVWEFTVTAGQGAGKNHIFNTMDAGVEIDANGTIISINDCDGYGLPGPYGGWHNFDIWLCVHTSAGVLVDSNDDYPTQGSGYDSDRYGAQVSSVLAAGDYYLSVVAYSSTGGSNRCPQNPNPPGDQFPADYVIAYGYDDGSGLPTCGATCNLYGATTAAPTTTVAPATTEITWANSSSSITEAVNAQIHYVTVNRDSSTGTATAYYETSDGTATAPVDYIAATGTVTFNAGETSKTIAIEIGSAGAANESDELFTITLSNPTWTNGAAQVSASPTHTVTVVNYTTTTVLPTTTTTTAAPECGAGYGCVCSVYACNMPYDWMNGEWVWSMTGIASHPIYRREDPNDSGQFGLLNWNTENFGIFHGWNIYYDIWDPATSQHLGRTDLYRNTQGGDCPYDSLVDNGWTWDADSGTVDLPHTSINDTNITCPTTTTTTAVPETYFAWSTVAAQTLAETAGYSLTLTVQRTGGLNASASVMYATSDITAVENFDYFGASGTLTFNSGVSSQTITLYPKEDNTLNGSETFKVTLSSPTHVGGPASIVWPADEGGNCTGGNSCANMPTAAENIVTMIERHDATVAFSSLTSSAAEGDSGTTTHTVTVTRDSTPTSGVVNEGTVTVGYATSDGTATAAEDYTAVTGTLTFAPGVTSQDIDVDITGDTNVENNETFNITLQNPSIDIAGVNAVIVSGYDVHVVTITNDDLTTTSSTTTTTTTTAAPSNACVAQTSGSEYYWNVDSTFTPVVGANATYYSRTQYVNADSSLWLVWNGTESLWKINDGVNNGGSNWYESDDAGTNPWDATWTNAYIGVTEKDGQGFNGSMHCYADGTSNFCIAGQGYYPEYEGTWVPYNTYGTHNKPVYWNQNAGSTNLFMWYDSTNSVWKINSDGWEPHEVNGYSSFYIESDLSSSATTPSSADWSSEIGNQTFDSINSGDC